MLASPALTGDGRNVAPDAVTRATTWNTWEGDLASLVDGQTPEGNPEARAFLWHGGGILVFEWEEPLVLESVRVYVGAIGNDYEVRAWLGGRLDENGTLREPAGTRTASVADHSRVTGGWTEVGFPPARGPTTSSCWPWERSSSSGGARARRQGHGGGALRLGRVKAGGAAR